MNGIILHGIRWPSIQQDSEQLRRRICGAQLVETLRARLAAQFERIAKAK